MNTGDPFYDQLAEIITGIVDWLASFIVAIFWLGLAIPIWIASKLRTRSVKAAEEKGRQLQAQAGFFGLQTDGNGLLLGEPLDESERI